MSDEVATSSAPKRKGFIKKLLKFVFVIIFLGLIATSGYFYYQYNKLAGSPVASQIQAEQEAQKTIEDVGKLILLSKDETPTVATVTDIDKLKDQPFFKDAKNGNKVLIYPNLKQVIVYDPIANLIINVGSVSFTDDKTQSVE